MEMAIVQGTDLAVLIHEISRLEKEHGVHTLRIAVEGGVKIKVNGGMWSPSIGRMAVGGY